MRRPGPCPHPSGEELLLETIIDRLPLPDESVRFRETHTGAELDLPIAHRHRRADVEIRRTTTIRATRSIRSAPDDFGLMAAPVNQAGRESCWLVDRVRKMAAKHLDPAPGVRKGGGGAPGVP